MWRGGFGRLFAADAISTSGTVISTLALQFVLIDTLQADQQAIGVVRAAQWAPYLFVGMLAGVLVDRVRRRPVLVVADLVSAAVFTAIGVLALTGRLTVPLLAALVFLAGTVTCAGVAAYQSYVPRLVPDLLLPAAFARLEQMGQVVGSLGPLISGSLVRFVTAPIAVLIDAATYVVSALTLWTIRTPEPAPVPPAHRDVRAELREGAAWVYRHDILRPYALWLHSWFFGISMVTTVVVYYGSTSICTWTRWRSASPWLPPASAACSPPASRRSWPHASGWAGSSPRSSGPRRSGRSWWRWLSRGPGRCHSCHRAPDRRAHRHHQFADDEPPHGDHAGPVAGPDERDDPHLQLGRHRRGRSDQRVDRGDVGHPGGDPVWRWAASHRDGIPVVLALPGRGFSPARGLLMGCTGDGAGLVASNCRYRVGSPVTMMSEPPGRSYRRRPSRRP
jgi:hypothetical protein